MDATWLNLLGHDLIGLIFVGLINAIWSHQAELKRFEQRWARLVGASKLGVGGWERCDRGYC